MIKRAVYFLSVIFLIFLGLVAWLYSLLEPDAKAGLKGSVPEDLMYLSHTPDVSRGKILAIVTSTDSMGPGGKYTGYELTELARAYYVFSANGFEVDVSSPQGGEPPMVLDNDDMALYDYAFLNDKRAQEKLKTTIPISNIKASDYRALYLVGGKGAMYDFPDNVAIQSLVREFYESGKVVGAICHGPAALVNVTLSNGQPLVEGKFVSGFTNEEELLLIPNAREIFPFLLQDKLVSKGGRFQAGYAYLEKITQDKNLLTGQNPWSVWKLAEQMVGQLGYEPVPREVTSEENTISVLATYEQYGSDQAKSHLLRLLEKPNTSVDRNLIAMHSIVAVMQAKVGKAIELIDLLRYAKKHQTIP